MPRKAHIVKREIVPDPVHDSTLLSKFVNCMMYGGKKSTAQRIVYGSLGIIQEKTQDDPMKLFKKAVENVKPVLEVKSRRVGGSTYQVARGSRPRTPHLAEHSLASYVFAGAGRKVDEREVGGRTH
jgi:small subunit ribosomal protein S7